MSQELTPALREKLVKVCSRLGSDHDGERAAAALLASRMLLSAGLSWSDVLVPAQPGSQPTPAPGPSASPPPGWGPPPGWEGAFKEARAKARWPRRPSYTPSEIRVMGRINECCAVINANTHLLKPHEKEGYVGLMRVNLNNLSANVRKDTLAGLEYLVGVIRRRQEEAV